MNVAQNIGCITRSHQQYVYCSLLAMRVNTTMHYSWSNTRANFSLCAWHCEHIPSIITRTCENLSQLSCELKRHFLCSKLQVFSISWQQYEFIWTKCTFVATSIQVELLSFTMNMPLCTIEHAITRAYDWSPFDFILPLNVAAVIMFHRSLHYISLW